MKALNKFTGVKMRMEKNVKSLDSFIGVSLSKPHTGELVVNFELYVCMYVSYNLVLGLI